jgi:geranylgeranyl diphosphate synthase type II
MDEAPLRRNIPTIHTIHGINTGILSGDGLLLKAYKYFEDLEPDLYKACVRVFTHTGLLLCEGQQYDINFETQKNVTYEDYIRMITYKTGVLSASSFQIGAMIAKASTEDAKAIFNFGKHLGIAFQMMDDYLDIFGDQESFGKKQGGDIYENKKTILYLIAKENASPEELKELEFWYSKKTDNVDKMYGVENIFRSTKADVKVLKLIQKHNDIAQSYLQKINIPEENKKPFVELTNYLLTREQ